MRSPFRRWLALVASFTTLAIAFSFGLFSLPAFYPVLIRQFGWSHAAAAAGGSIVLLLIGTFSPVTGWLVDRYSPKTVLLGGVFTVAMALILLSGAQTLTTYYAFCLLLGIGTSAVSILPNSILIAPWFTRGRASAVGLINAGIGLGGVAPLLATSQFERRGIGGTFLFLAFWMAIPLLLILFLVPRGHTKASRGDSPQLGSFVQPAGPVPRPSELVRMPLFWIFGFSVFFAAHSMVAVQQNLVLYLRGQHISAGRAALALSFAVWSSAPGKILSGAISDRFSARWGVVFSVVCIGLGITTLLTIPPSSDLIFLFAVIFGLGYGGIFNATPAIVFEYFGARGVGAVMGMFLIFFGLGTSSGGLLAGYLFDRTHRYSVPFTLDLALAAAALLLLLAAGNLGLAVSPANLTVAHEA
ncbi:MAG: MFS transporter [Acidobacteriia bacterium]|nr:MFS transporter [Terriglobia bacterium]MBV8907031.1 MFS transporter [Terriglobia bacterium]